MRFLFLVTICVGLAFSAAEGKTAKKKGLVKAKGKATFNVDVSKFKKQSKKKQLQLVQALREWALKNESSYPLEYTKKKNAFLFNLIEEASAQETPAEPPPGDEGDGYGDTCMFGGWFTTTGHSRRLNKISCMHPEISKLDIPNEYRSGKCVGSKSSDAVNKQILCNPFLAGEGDDRCVGFAAATKDCIAKDPTGEAALKYILEHEEDFKKYLAEVASFCEGTTPDPNNVGDGKAAGRSEIADAGVKRDQAATCAILLPRLRELDIKIEPSKAQAAETAAIEEAKIPQGGDIACGFQYGDRTLNLYTVPGNKLAIRDSKGLRIGGDLAVNTSRVGSRYAYKVRTDLGYLTFYRDAQQADTTCDGAWLSASPQGPPVEINGWQRCGFKFDGDNSEFYKFQVEYEKDGTGCKILKQTQGSGFETYREGQQVGGECRFDIGEKDKPGIPAVYKIGEACGRIEIPLGSSGGGATNPVSGGTR